jgi:hypothetical protein
MEPHGVFKEVTKQSTNKDHYQAVSQWFSLGFSVPSVAGWGSVVLRVSLPILTNPAYLRNEDCLSLPQLIRCQEVENLPAEFVR